MLFLTLVVNNVNCKILLLQRQTVVFGTLYTIPLADRSCITQPHACVTAQCTGWLPFGFLFCWISYFPFLLRMVQRFNSAPLKVFVWPYRGNNTVPLQLSRGVWIQPTDGLLSLAAWRWMLPGTLQLEGHPFNHYNINSPVLMDFPDCISIWKTLTVRGQIC